MRLRHIHLPSDPARGIFPTYRAAAYIQDRLRRALLASKAATITSALEQPQQNPSSPPLPAPPPPTLLTFTPEPTYTLGRRQASTPLPPQTLARLSAPLHIHIHDHHHHKQQTQTFTFTPAILPSPRGGLTTYHGPGQLVLWPILDLRSPHLPSSPHHTVRSYASLLEATTAAALRSRFPPHLDPFTTDDPGVWVRSPPSASPSSPPSRSASSASSSSSSSSSTTSAPERQEQAEGGELRKIAAMGVHLRRHVTGLGVAVNLCTPTTSGRNGDEDEATNPWARFVACGLEGKGVTCVAEELARWQQQQQQQQQQDPSGSPEERSKQEGIAHAPHWAPTLDSSNDNSSSTSKIDSHSLFTPDPSDASGMADAWAAELAQRLGLRAPWRVGEDAVRELIAAAEQEVLLEMDMEDGRDEGVQ